MLSHANDDLKRISARAPLIVADGTPFVWTSRLQGTMTPVECSGSAPLAIFAWLRRSQNCQFSVLSTLARPCALRAEWSLSMIG
jgi:UDP-N-acetyl-D-mannosaminuronic acid transferase (WecB/TagA/CpsF family)